MVERFIESLVGKNFYVFFDSFFILVSFVRVFLVKRIFFCGIIVRNRKGFLSDLKLFFLFNKGDFFIRYKCNLLKYMYMYLLIIYFELMYNYFND